jgi:hypothetical protein
MMKNLLVDSNIFCIFTFILIISANFLAEIFPCRLQYVLRNNMFIKHVFGLFTMIFFVVLSSEIKNKNIFNIFNSSFLLYILFILITKCQIYAFYIILLFLGITYIIQILKQKEIESSKKEPNEKESNKEGYSIYDNIIYVLYILIIIFVILGVIMYMGEKKIEYKKNFDYITFFIGKPLCTGKSPKVNVIESLKNAFN